MFKKKNRKKYDQANVKDNKSIDFIHTNNKKSKINMAKS